jgi:hypothetical protein
MIGDPTETSQTALNLALTFEQLCWPRAAESYAALRDEAQRLIDDLAVEGVVLPETQEGLLADVGSITTPITAHLSAERGRILGDTVALPLFFLESFALRLSIHQGLGEGDAQLVGFIEDCLEDLGLDRELTRSLEREAGWIKQIDDDGEAYVRWSDVIKVGSSFALRVLEEYGRRAADTGGIVDAIAALRADVADFREEFRAASTRLEQLVAEGNADVVGALDEVKVALVAEEDLDPGQAAQLTEGDPQRFWERLMRWFGGAPARDAAEAALWAALDFVPAGAGVKLGIKVAGAIRKSLKSG